VRPADGTALGLGQVLELRDERLLARGAPAGVDGRLALDLVWSQTPTEHWDRRRTLLYCGAVPATRTAADPEGEDRT
jgi:hypothetical protein